MSNIEKDLNFIHEMIRQFYKVRTENQVSSIVKKYNMDYDDVFQVACIAYLRAEKRFDQSKGYKLLTFAGHCIKGDLTKITDFYKSKKRDPTEFSFISLDDTTKEETPLSELLTVEDRSYTDVENETVVSVLLAELSEQDLFYIDEIYFKERSQSEMAKCAGINQTSLRMRIIKVLNKMREVAVG